MARICRHDRTYCFAWASTIVALFGDSLHVRHHSHTSPTVEHFSFRAEAISFIIIRDALEIRRLDGAIIGPGFDTPITQS